MKMATTVKIATAMDYELLAEMALDDTLTDDDMPGIDLQLESYLIDSEIGRQVHAAKLSAPESASRIVSDFIATSRRFRPDTVLHDEQAMFWIISEAMFDERIVSEEDHSRSARRAAHDLIFHQLLSQKVAPGAFKRVFAGTAMTGPAPEGAARAALWASELEWLQFRSQPMWVKYCRLWAAPPRRLKEKTRQAIDKVDSSMPWERHKTSAFSRVWPDSHSYNYAGVLVTFVGTRMLVMDSSLADYARTCLASYRNAHWSFAMLRVSGDAGMSDQSFNFAKCIAWIRRAISDVKNARYVARHMHLAYTRWQNAVCEDDAPIDCGWQDRDSHLMKDMVQYYPHNDIWYNMVMALNVSKRTRAEFFKLYHLLPPPDIDPLLLHETLVERTGNENDCSDEAVTKFLDFCKSYDLCRFLSKRHADPKIGHIPGYVPKDQAWYMKSKAGKLTLPPLAERGHAWIEKEFPYDPTGDYHIFDAKDCTRVVADLGKYVDRSQSRDLSRVDQNELLSAIFNGSRLSNGEFMNEWRSRVMHGQLTSADQVIAAEAGKAENTKPGAKVRETLSASDNAREFLTEVDHSLRPLAELTPGVSIRVDLVKHKKKFQAMARAISADSTTEAFATSTDISGWSPKMSRRMFHRWQTYALTTTECPNPSAPISLWDRLILFCDRRGVKASAACKTGNIQGWPATSDTTMHAHILIYWAYRLRELKILSQREAAYILCLIDDAATVVALEGNPDECAKKAKDARELLKKTYTELGFEMDEVKSFFSSIKFVYLNELYIDGTQVSHATKTMMRIDKDFTRRFSSVTDNINTAFGTASSAAAQGADPFVAYFLAAWHSFQWVFKACPRLASAPTQALSIAALAPAQMNGLGIKSICSTMATGELDHLTWFIEVAGHLCVATSERIISNLFNSILQQPAADRDARAVFTSPYGYAAASHTSAATAVRSMFREAARGVGLAEPFASLDKIESSEEYNAALDSVLKAGIMEAPLLEEVSSCMPEAFVDEVMGRVDRTELVSYLLGARGIGDARRMVSACDSRNLSVLEDLVFASIQAYGSHDMVGEFERDGSFLVAQRLRDAVLARSGYTVINHTYPCPFAMWAFVGEIDLESRRAQEVTTVSFDQNRMRQTAGSVSKNMYDSSTRGIGYKGYRSLKSNVANEVRVALYNPVRKKIAQGLAAFRWAQDTGAHHYGLFTLFSWMWAGSVDFRLLTLPGRRFEGSAKRLSLRHSKANHVISMFSNCQAAVRVNANAITRLNARTRTMYDMMAAITVLRCAGLLEAALYVRMKRDQFAYGFAYKETGHAPLIAPTQAEGNVDDLAIRQLTPFVSIESDLKQHAQVSCSYANMSRALQMYASSGALAAQRVYDAALEEGEIPAIVVQEHEEVVSRVQVIELSTRYSDVARVWGAPILRSRPQSAGSVTSDSRGQSAASNLLLLQPDVPSRQLLQALGESWIDSITLDLILKDDMFANEVCICHRAHRIDRILNAEGWATKAHSVKPRTHEVRVIVREIEDLRGTIPMHEAIAQFTRSMGASGYRASDATTDHVHALDSFLSTTSALLGLCSGIGQSMSKLQHKTTEEYSKVTVLSSRTSVGSVARVLQAQWLFAAARRQKRGNDAAAEGHIDDRVTKGNYESAFLRSAARALGATGRMYENRLHEAIVSQTIRSMQRRIHNESDRDKFTLEVDDFDLEMIELGWTDNDLIHRVQEVITLAISFGAEVNVTLVIQAMQQVLLWVRQDVDGAHRAVPRSKKSVRLSLTPSAPAAPPSNGLTRLSWPPAPRDEDQGNGEGSSRAVMATATDALVDAPMPSGEIHIPAAIVGDTAAISDDIMESNPASVVYWAVDTAARRAALAGIGFGGNIHEYYAQITSSRDEYDRWLAAAAAVISFDDYEEPMFSAFPEVYFEDDSDNVVAD